MNKLTAIVFGFALIISGFQISDSQAFIKIGQERNLLDPDQDTMVILIHNCHNDCQKGSNGNSHWHGGAKCKRHSCPGGKKYSPEKPSLDCPDGACLGNPDGSLINHSPLPSSDRMQQQTH